MEEYHIGKEIEKEVRKQYPSIDAFAKALHRERQTVYDIFKRAHIATDRLMEVSRILNRDFFQELSLIYKNGGQEKEEDESDVAERIGRLMEEDGICVKSPFQLEDVADEFYLTKRTKPLVVFYDNGTNTVISTMAAVATKILGDGMVKSVSVKKDELSAFEASILDIAALPQKAIHLMCIDLDYDSILLIAEKLIKTSGKHVVVFFCCTNKIYEDRNGRIGYRSLADSCFSTWKKRANMFVADNSNNDFARTRELYNASMCRGILDQIDYHLFENRDDEAKLLLQKLISCPFIHTCKEKDMGNGICRLHITTLLLCQDEKSMMEKTHCNPLLSMWIDVVKDTGAIVDWEKSLYNRLFGNR